VERQQQEGARRAVAEEQARIARELHDVISHNVSVMVAQAAAGGDVFATRVPNAPARRSARSGRPAGTRWSPLRRLLVIVRPGDEGDGDGDGFEHAPLRLGVVHNGPGTAAAGRGRGHSAQATELRDRLAALGVRGQHLGDRAADDHRRQR
jgi:Histidine kinase